MSVVSAGSGHDVLSLRHPIGLAVGDARDPTRWRRHGG
jgi:hypothetical protein